ncbi:NUDIX domain-containing protein [Tomitella biformata]|uniref:NUDIX domain-containing protein n=1 Tax=Tomitella biformata TaxID=630403 RepID=UPI0004661E11|nr:NUDIX hydrolase [Tomitella biformata]
MTPEQTPAARHEFVVTGSQTHYSGAIVALRVDTVAMPGGRAAKREVVEHHGAVVILALDEQDQVILIRQYRHPLGMRIWELPAGLLDMDGESPVIGAGRELAEEVGLAAARWSVLVDIAASPGFTDETLRIYLAEGLSEVDRPMPEDEEADIEIHRIPLAEAVAMALRGEIINGAAVSGLLALAAIRSGAATPRPVDAPMAFTPHAFTDRRRAQRPAH